MHVVNGISRRRDLGCEENHRRESVADVLTNATEAIAAGLNTQTKGIPVSRTINGHPYVADETAKKVRAAIRRLNYRPNHAARMLTGQLSRSIGLIVPDLADSFFSVISHTAQETAREGGI